METIFLEHVAHVSPGYQRIILRDLIDNEFVTYDRLGDQLWLTCDDPPLLSRKTITVSLCRIRKKLLPGWRIVTRHGQGLSLVHTEPPAINEAA